MRQAPQRHTALIKADRRKICMVWSLGCVFLLAVLWVGLAIDIKREREEWRALVLENARAFATIHADHVEKSIDQINLLLDAFALARPITVSNEDLLRQLKQADAQENLHPLYVDRSGQLRFAGLDKNAQTLLQSQAFYDFHRRYNSAELRISLFTTDALASGSTNQIALSKRVNRSDGSFDGIVLVFVPLSYFNAKTTNTSSLSLRDWPASSGILKEDGALFDQDGVRTFGWKKLRQYPLMSMAVIERDRMLPGASPLENSHFIFGVISSLLLILMALFGMRWHLQRYAQHYHPQTGSFSGSGTGDLFLFITTKDASKSTASEFIIRECSGEALRFLGMEQWSCIGKSIDALFSPEDAVQINQFLSETLQENSCQSELLLGERQTTRASWFNLRAVVSDGGIALTFSDISSIKEKEAQLKTMALTDALTMLPNRHWLNQSLPAELDVARRAGHKLVLLFVDLDDFKSVNDTQGHAAGDAFLIAIAAALQHAVRKNDQVVRLGGDEFMVLSQVDGDSDPETIAQSIAVQIFAKLATLDCAAVGTTYRASASIGAAVFPNDASEAEALIQAADTAMYASKASGKGRFTPYSTGMATQLKAKLQLQQALQLAVKHDELLLYFQPRANAKTGALVCLEALLRWQRPQLGLAVPDEFIYLAEQSHLIVEIGNWVIDKSCQQLASWREQGLPAIPVSVNVSVRQLKSSEFRQQLASSLLAHRISPALIAIELTESKMVGDDPVVQAELRLLRKMGIELHIDDFGTGYSSLSQLQSLDVDAIKIDQSFVQSIALQSQGRKLCEAMVQIGKTMGFRVVAQGVETATQLRELQLMQCDEVQGFWISPPVPAQEVAELLNKRSFFDPYFPVVRRMVSQAFR